MAMTLRFRCHFARTSILTTGLALFAGAAPGAVAVPLAWKSETGYRVAPVAVGTAGATRLALLPPEQTGIRFTNDVAYARSEENQNLLNGAGVAAGDFDGDGLCDLYFCNTGGANALFRNLGQFRFEDVTARAGVACTHLSSKGAVFADINGDGRLDLIVNSLSGPNACFVNLGDGRFTNVTTTAGITAKAGGHSIAMADVDGDGDLDLYLLNYGENSILRSGGEISVRTVNNKPVVTGRYRNRLKIINGLMVEMGEPDTLYLNNGQGVFTPVPWTGGAFLDEAGQPLKIAPWDMGLSAMFRDLNGDGAPDLYVCNDFQTPDRIWINDGRGRFRALAPLALRHTPHFSMGVDFADINRDGWDDFFVGDMLSRFQRLRMTQLATTNPPPEQVEQPFDRPQYRRNSLFLSRGDGTYADIANFAGVDASDWSWSVVFLDVDLDGYEDLLVANAHAYDTQDLDMHEKSPEKLRGGMNTKIGKNLKDFPRLFTPNFLFRNRGDLTFEELGAKWNFHSTNVSHGIALADLDLDGDQDVVVSCLWDAPLIYRNDASEPRVAVRLRGKPGNGQGIGAKIKVLGGAVPSQTQEIVCGGRYLAGDDPMRVFAAGHATNRLVIEVTWRSGARSVISNAAANAIYEIDESGATPAAHPKSDWEAPKPAPLFTDFSPRINHSHQENPFDDLQRQPLLPRSLASLGPGVAWIDLDGDGPDELIVGAGQGGLLAVFRGDGRGGFTRWAGGALSTPMGGDVLGLAPWVTASGQHVLLAAMSSYEDARETSPAVTQFTIDGTGSGKMLPIVPRFAVSPGPLAVSDFDGDGDLDLFVGGRVIPGRYPETASSQIFRNDNGALKLDAQLSAPLAKVGLVSAAMFSDLEGDGWPELILACEWGPLKIFRNQRGQFSAWNPNVAERGIRNAERGTSEPERGTLNSQLSTLNDLTGWWTSVTTGDFDGDGRLDVLAGNWGLNSSYHMPEQAPLRLYFGDFDGNGSLDVLDAFTDAESGRIVPRHDLTLLGAALPPLRGRFATHRAFAQADVAGILGAAFATTPYVQARTLASVLLLNRGDHFESVPLPAEAQFAPVFGLSVADFDGDGAEDAFLAQNFFANRNEEPRLDAGRGLLLRGDGKGRLAAVSGWESGIEIYGEQRGCAAADFDADGRTDLVIAQNGGATRLFRNAGAKPGLRVRLQGPPGNPLGLGAVVRLKFGERLGPAREVRGGSGYLSCDSAVLVMGQATAAASISVRWPGGKTSEASVPGQAEVIVPFPK